MIPNGRVDKGFVAQVADVVGGRQMGITPILQVRSSCFSMLLLCICILAQLVASWKPLTEHGYTPQSQAEADKTVPLEVQRGIIHTKGVISMGRWDDPNSGKSSFSILLGDAPHLDMQYTIFGSAAFLTFPPPSRAKDTTNLLFVCRRVTSGLEVLSRMEQVETTRQGIFVMPKERITIASTYVYSVSGSSGVANRSGGWRGGNGYLVDNLWNILSPTHLCF